MRHHSKFSNEKYSIVILKKWLTACLIVALAAFNVYVQLYFFLKTLPLDFILWEIKATLASPHFAPTLKILAFLLLPPCYGDVDCSAEKKVRARPLIVLLAECIKCLQGRSPLRIPLWEPTALAQTPNFHNYCISHLDHVSASSSEEGSTDTRDTSMWYQLVIRTSWVYDGKLLI